MDDPGTNPLHERIVIDFIKTCGDIRLEHLRVAARGVEVNLRDSVLRPTTRPKPIRRWLEISLEDWLQYQFQGSLNDSIGHRRNPQATDLTVCFRNRLLPHSFRVKLSKLHVCTQLRKHSSYTFRRNGTRNDSIGTGSTTSLAALYPIPRRNKECWVMGKRFNTSSKRRTESLFAHWCSFVCIFSTRAHASVVSAGHDTSVFTVVSPLLLPDSAITLNPFAMWSAFPTSDYYEFSAPPRPDQQATCPAENRCCWVQQEGRRSRDGSHVHSQTI